MLLGSEKRPLRVAIIGAGPSGFYAAGGLLQQSEYSVTVDMFDRLPAPYGLVRYGVAPDHQKIKSVRASSTGLHPARGSASSAISILALTSPAVEAALRPYHHAVKALIRPPSTSAKTCATISPLHRSSAPGIATILSFPTWTSTLTARRPSSLAWQCRHGRGAAFSPGPWRTKGHRHRRSRPRTVGAKSRARYLRPLAADRPRSPNSPIPKSVSWASWKTQT